MIQRTMLVGLTLMASLGIGAVLIRPVQVYKSLIEGIHEYFNNTCIILLHGTPNPTESEGESNNWGQKCPIHFAKSQFTYLYFYNWIGKTYFRIKRPLFVILNDQGSVKDLLSRVSTWITMAYPTWVIFFSEGSSIEDFFEDVVVPFDCEFLVCEGNATTETITEVYRVAPGTQLRKIVFGSWNEEDGVRKPELSFYTRRHDLFGHTLRITSLENPPMSSIRYDRKGRMIGLGGMFGQILEILAVNMNCTFVYAKSDVWGSLSEDNHWSGMMGMLHRKEVDVAVSEVVMTSARAEAVDFTIPIFSSRYYTFIKRPSFAFVKWEGYTAPFHPRIWAAVGLLIIVASVTIALIENTRPSTDVKNPDETRMKTMVEIIFAVYGAFCSQGIRPSVYVPTRSVHLAVHLTGVTIVAAYSASLVSFLAVQSFTMPFTTMEGLLKEGTYRFGVISQSAEYDLFSNTTDKVLQALFHERMEDDSKLPVNYLEGLKRVCQEDKYAFMASDIMENALEEQVDCIVESLDLILQTSLAMAVTKKSHYRGIINSNILKLRDGGILMRIIKSGVPARFTKKAEPWVTVDFGDVLPLLVILSAGAILGCFILSIEQMMYRRHNSRKGRKVKKIEFRTVPWTHGNIFSIPVQKRGT